MTTEIVVVSYAADLSWLAKIDARKTVYLKGPVEYPGGERIPNLGHLDGTYLQHIVTRWDSLADLTCFSQDHPFDHLPPGSSINDLLASEADVTFARLWTGREWGADGRIAWDTIGGKWLEQVRSGDMSLSPYSLKSWFDYFLCLNIDDFGYITYSPGSIFSVRREVIHQRQKRFYEWAWGQLCEHRNPEAAHYMERSWNHLWNFPRVRITQLPQFRRGPEVFKK